jgi:peptidoglycan/LPS O-acetylase OafA/YrhL
MSAPPNNFNILRLVAAASVLVSHSYLLLGFHDGLMQLTGQDLGWSALMMFFGISGFLISQSAQRRSFGDFWRARFLRIFPGLGVCTLVTVLVLSTFTTIPVAEYFADPQTRKFLFGNATLLATEYRLPGVFQGEQVNGSLWTLRYEMMCYAIVWFGLIGVGGVRLPRPLFLVLWLGGIAGVLSVTWFAPQLKIPIQIVNIVDLSFPFMVGAAYSGYGTGRVPLWHVGGAALLFALTFNSPLMYQSMAFLIVVGTLYLSTVQAGWLRAVRDWPDYSYGVYIYAYPIQQILVSLRPDSPPWALAALSFALVLIPASLSWHGIEAPALRMKRTPRPPLPSAPSLTA